MGIDKNYAILIKNEKIKNEKLKRCNNEIIL